MTAGVGPPGVPTDVDVLLADGSTARLRMIRPDDGPLVVAFHSRLSAESIRLRFFTPTPSSPIPRWNGSPPTRRPDQMALVAEVRGNVVAIGQYDRPPGDEEAEVAFAVDDVHQRLGLATLLLEHLATVAPGTGSNGLFAVTLGENRAMLEVFRHAGFAPRMSWECGEVHVVLDIAPSPTAVAAAYERDRSAVVSRWADPQTGLDCGHRSWAPARHHRPRDRPQPARVRVHRSALSGQPRRTGGGRRSVLAIGGCIARLGRPGGRGGSRVERE